MNILSNLITKLISVNEDEGEVNSPPSQELLPRRIQYIIIEICWDYSLGNDKLFKTNRSKYQFGLVSWHWFERCKVIIEERAHYSGGFTFNTWSDNIYSTATHLKSRYCLFKSVSSITTNTPHGLYQKEFQKNNDLFYQIHNNDPANQELLELLYGNLHSLTLYNNQFNFKAVLNQIEFIVIFYMYMYNQSQVYLYELSINSYGSIETKSILSILDPILKNLTSFKSNYFEYALWNWSKYKNLKELNVKLPDNQPLPSDWPITVTSIPTDMYSKLDLPTLERLNLKSIIIDRFISNQESIIKHIQESKSITEVIFYNSNPYNYYTINFNLFNYVLDWELHLSNLTQFETIGINARSLSISLRDGVDHSSEQVIQEFKSKLAYLPQLKSLTMIIQRMDNVFYTVLLDLLIYLSKNLGIQRYHFNFMEASSHSCRFPTLDYFNQLIVTYPNWVSIDITLPPIYFNQEVAGMKKDILKWSNRYAIEFNYSADSKSSNIKLQKNILKIKY